MTEYPSWLPKKYQRPLLRERTAAELLNRHPRTLKFWRSIKKPEGFPDPTYVGESPMYKTIEIINYLEKNGNRGK